MGAPVEPAAPLPVLAIERQALGLVLRGRRAFLVTGLAAHVLVGLVLTPAIFWLLAEGLSMLRADVVLNFDLASLALSPAGVLLAIVWAIGAAIVGVLALGGACAVAALTLRGRRPALRAVARHVFARLQSVPGLGALKLSAWIALLAPAALAVATALTWLLFSPFGGGPARLWIPKEVAQLAWISVVVVALALVAFALFVRWSIAIPCLVLERLPLGEAMKRSARLVKPRAWAVARVLAVFLFVDSALFVGGTLVSGLFTWAVLAVANPDGKAFLFLLALCLVLASAVLVIVVALSVAHGMSVAVLLHDRLSGVRPDLSPLEASGGPRPAGTRRSLRTAAVVALVLAGAAAWTVPAVRAELEGAARPVGVTAHRGASAEAPENTLAALERAVVIGATWAEFDFQQAADGSVVMLHDVSLARTAGVDREVWRMTLPELRELDIGSWFDERFAGERIATLDEVLEAARGRIRLNIELKTHGHETDFVARAVRSIRTAGMVESCVITSLDLAALAEVRRRAPELRIGAILSASIGRLGRLDVDFYSVQPNYATVAFIRNAHDLGRAVHVWTLNDAKSLTAYIDRAVDNVITDEPALALRLLAARGPADEMEAAVRRLLRP